MKTTPDAALLQRFGATALAIAALAFTAGCGGSSNNDDPAPTPAPAPVPVAPPAPVAQACDETLQNGFKPDEQTQVLLVREFKAGEPLLLSGSPGPQTMTASKDVCMVKLLVGPGNPGPADAPSTSAGIGIEVWLPAPANWNDRIHVKGGGGWAGGVHTSTTALAGASTSSAGSPAATAMVEGAVSASTDTGHANTANGGSFAMNPDGTINTVLWRDFSERGVHEMAVKTKALTRAYYGRDARYAYWNGFSTGGRQGHKEAQAHPTDFDGILAGAPAFNWTKFITAELYPQIVMQRDLGGTLLTAGQMNLMGNAAIASCDVAGGQHLGYIPDPSFCRYDPTTDPEVLCRANGGINDTENCVSPVQASAMNKMWYGQTTDGSVPPTSDDLGFDVAPRGNQRWYGLARGTSMSRLAGPTPFTISTDMVALQSQMPSLATPSFINATGNGADVWRNLTYDDLSRVWDQGVALQSQFADINTDNPDLSTFRNRNGKMIMYHGLADPLIPPQGSINYYNRVLAQMGDVTSVQAFYRFYLVPGMGHGFSNGTTKADANPPLPTNEQLYDLLTNWIENGVAPGRVDIGSAVGTSRPICPYPQKATYTAGDPMVAASYTCS